MYAARIIGTVVATQKDPRMNSFKMQIVQPVNLITFENEGKPAVAVDAVGAGDNESCIFYLDKIIQNKDLKMREDLLCFSRVLNLVAHYEAGIDSNIEKLIVSTYKFLLKMNDLHQVQRKMIEFLKNLSNIYPQDLKKEFIKLHLELKKYENHPFERRAFLYLDILSWLESKIHNVSVESIIQTKAKKLLK